jgi:AraC family transcriptional activator of pobA
LQEEYREDYDAREMMMHSLLGALLVWLNRQYQPHSSADKAERKRSVMRHFSRLIESHYREHMPLAGMPVGWGCLRLI